MFDRLIFKLKHFPHHLIFTYGDVELQGLQLEKKKSYPWKNRRERNAWYGERIEGDEAEDYQRILHWMEINCLEVVHIRLSWSYVMSMIFQVGLIPVIISLLARQWYLAMIYGAFCLLVFCTGVGLHFLAKKKYQNWIMSRVLFTFLRDRDAEESETTSS